MTQNHGKTKAGSEIIGALTEIRDALRSGAPIEKMLTVRTVELDLRPHPYGREDVKRVRKLINASQPLFAMLLGVDVDTVRSWEQGKRDPSPMACRFMDEIVIDPDRWRNRLRNAVTSKASK